MNRRYDVLESRIHLETVNMFVEAVNEYLWIIT